MPDKLVFELVSPETLLFSGEVDMVVLPAADGDMGVLPGHSPVIATVRPGTICVYEGTSVTRRLFVAGGFVEVTQKRCTVLAETAIPIQNIDTAAVQSEIRDLGEDVGHARDAEAKARAELALAVAEAKLRAARSPVYK